MTRLPGGKTGFCARPNMQQALDSAVWSVGDSAKVCPAS
jgi:hypothetical protein